MDARVFDSQWSPSSRRAWIEIAVRVLCFKGHGVALLAEGVDRNWTSSGSIICAVHVALLAEGVDRNWQSWTQSIMHWPSPSSRRAWIEIGLIPLLQRDLVSPSSRRAWIEIPSAACSCRSCPVALLAEGVDRNCPSSPHRTLYSRLPSSRRAQVEIDTKIW